jgi:acetoacetyl-CoA synthetase
MKQGLQPGKRFNLSSLRSMGSTGSPLTQEHYEWIYREVAQDVMLASISGGTDPGAAFLTSCPLLPIYSGEMQCRGLGCAVAAFDDAGNPLVDEVGELVVTLPMPSMPLYFWGDSDGSRYFGSYFDQYPGVWRHGDWLKLIPRPEGMGAVIYGRSDSTINRHGIRMGTSELYRVVEQFDAVADSLAIDLEYLGKPSFLALFVVPADMPAVDTFDLANPSAASKAIPLELKEGVKQAIRTQLSARHVPDEVFFLPEVPRTLSGKKLEVPVKRLLLGHAPEKAVNRSSMANPDVIDWILEFAQHWQSQA